MATLDPDYPGYQNVTLMRGAHIAGTNQYCFAECVLQEGYKTYGESWDGGAISIVLRQTGQRINDAVGDSTRQLLKSSIVAVMNSSNADGALEKRRAYKMIDGSVRQLLAGWLDFSGYTSQATTLRNLAPITSASTAQSASIAMRSMRVTLNTALSSKQAVVGPPTQYAYRAYQAVISGAGLAFLLPSDLSGESLVRSVDSLQGNTDKATAIQRFGGNASGYGGGWFDTLGLLAIGSFREAVAL